MPRAFITGVTGQDGWYLSELLAAEGADVYGLVSVGDGGTPHPAVVPVGGDVRDEASLRAALATARPDEVFHLASMSSVADSWRDPALVADVNGLGTLRLLSALRDSGSRARVVCAGSAEIFGDAPAPQDEHTPVAPVNPYGAAKAYAHHVAHAYRRAGMWVAGAILFNHESPRRPDRFVTQKIARGVAGIAAGSSEPLRLGNLAARRDWGFAGDYVQALVAIARHERPDDFVVATGTDHSVEDFVRAAFAHVGIEDWRAHVTIDPGLTRDGDPRMQRGDASKAAHELGWTPTLGFTDLVTLMVDAARGTESVV